MPILTAINRPRDSAHREGLPFAQPGFLMSRTRAGAFVLGLFDTGLAAVRSLGRAGISVCGFDSDGSEPGFRSRYGTHVLCPDPARNPEALLELLVGRARLCEVPPVLYVTSDRFVRFVSEYREALQPFVRHALPSLLAVATPRRRARHA